MASLFPGMDPWLEDPERWTEVHTRLVVSLGDALVRALRPRYEVRVEERIYVEDDALAFQGRANGAIVGGPTRSSGTAGQVIAPVTIPTVMDTEVVEPFLTIRATGGEPVIAVLEVLSPKNKRGAEAEGGRQYLTKRARVLHSIAHLVELDLLRAGRRVPMQRPLPPAAYYAIVSRADRRPSCDVWPIPLRQRLPVIQVPLRGDEVVPLDLQAVLDEAFDRAGWDYTIDRTADPTPPLAPDDLAWARAQLSARAS